MKPRTLARIALKNIENKFFTFDCIDRKKEALRVIEDVLHGKPDIDNAQLDDPIVELHCGVYIPNFDYPLVPVNQNNEPIVWTEDDESYQIPGRGTHIFRGIGISGEPYYMGYLSCLAPFRESVIKVDRYTDVNHAAFAFMCTMTRVIDKDYALDHMVEDYGLKNEFEVLLEHWQDISKTENLKDFETEQKHLYIKWLNKWILTHGTNPDTHMRVLRNIKQTPIENV